MFPWRNDHRAADQVLLWTARVLGLVSATVLGLIVVFLIRESSPALWNVGPFRFLTDDAWRPTADRWSLLPMLAATVLVTAGAIALAAPLGFLSAIFCRFLAPAWIASIYRRMVELLCGIPSVVYGFWGLTVLAPWIRAISPQPQGQSVLAGSIVLALMILPTVALLAEASLTNVPREYFQAAAALGFSRWGTIRWVAFPAARAGLGTAALLATARALGETMAVLMVCGNVAKTPGSIFDSARTLTANIALELDYAVGDHRSALFLGGLLLAALVAALVGLAEWIAGRKSHA
ncbi:MAG: phosphate ABC transporter permease subunit PstC [Planctomycetales bacterium]